MRFHSHAGNGCRADMAIALHSCPLPYGGIIHFRFQGTGSRDPSQPFGAPSGFFIIKHFLNTLSRIQCSDCALFLNIFDDQHIQHHDHLLKTTNETHHLVCTCPYHSIITKWCQYAYILQKPWSTSILATFYDWISVIIPNHFMQENTKYKGTKQCIWSMNICRLLISPAKSNWVKKE